MCKECGVELHVHSQISVDGISTPTELVHRAKELGQNAIAFTEHFEANSIVEASAAGKKIGIKTIAGCEYYVDIAESYEAPLMTHLTILGNGVKGYNDIVRIQKCGVMRTVKNTTNARFYSRPPVYIKDIFDYSDDLIVLSGCPASVFNDTRKFQSDVIESHYNKFKKHFGDRFYVEIMLSSEDIGGVSKEERIRTNLMYARKYNLRFVVTSDVHFSKKEHHAAHDFYKKMVLGFDYDSSDLYMRSAMETMTILQGLNLTQQEKSLLTEGVLEQQKIADRLLTASFDTGIIMPEIPNGVAKFGEIVEAEYFRHLQIEDYIDDEYTLLSRERLDEEMSVISQMGFETYFLLVYEMHEFVEQTGGKKPYGRGSSGGSFVCFLLGIVKLNPMFYGLYFERMLNLQRNSAIDIDADFGKEDRERLIEEYKRQYNIIPIVTHMKYGHDSLINDICRYEKYNIPPSNQKILKSDELGFRETQVWKDLENEFPEINIVYDQLIKKIKNKSRHAAGFVLPQKDSPYEIPMTIDKNGNILCALVEGLSAAEASELGLNKFDLLGNDGLNFVHELEKVTGRKAPVWRYEEYDESFTILESGKTDGIFQYSGSAVGDYATKHKVNSFRDIMDITSLARKGVMIAGVHEEILGHRPVKGLPKRRSNGEKDNGDIVQLTLETGSTFRIYENWEIHTINRGWILVRDLDQNDRCTIE